MNTRQTLLRSSVVLYFVIAFEVLIMISPFAGFFYAAFNPFLLKLNAVAATRWLSAFYLPHMVLPQDGFLQLVRVAGSFLFTLGLALFLVCAAQIYTAKFMKRGAVLGGLYSIIRHPQYLALGISGLGLSILWPRILTLVLWLAMAFVYYALARDEERRMLAAYPDTYRSYRDRTGMFLPKTVERAIAPRTTRGRLVFAVLLAAVVLCTAFLLRSYTINSLTLWTKDANVTAVAILPEDGFKMEHRMGDLLALPDIRKRLQANERYLVYFLPTDYIMQGMIADTGGDWQLYKQHHALAMITDWVLHPFGHLRGGHHAGHSAMTGGPGATLPAGGITRRLIVLEVTGIAVHQPTDVFSINALRVPQFVADVDLHNAALLDVRDLPHGSGWGTVPTPTF